MSTASNKKTVTWNLAMGATSIYMGIAFLFGYNFAILNQSVQLIRSFIAESYTVRYGSLITDDNALVSWLWTLINISLFVGALLGAFLVGPLADRFGRSKSMAMMQVFSIGGAIVFEAGYRLRCPEVLVAGRFVIGIHTGFASSFGSLFLSEIAPLHMRGALLIGNQVFFTMGVFTSSLFGIAPLMGTMEYWHYISLVNVIPSLVCLLIVPWIHDSPRFLLIMKNDVKRATKALQFYRGSKHDIAEEIVEMQSESKNVQKENDTENGARTSMVKYTMWSLLSDRELRTPVSIACMLQVIQQFSGINGIFFYSVGIYTETGLRSGHVQYAVLLTSAVFVIGSLVSVPLLDRIGRKPLLFYPMIVMILSLILMTISLNLKDISWMPYLSTGMVLLFVAMFSIGLGGIPIMLSAELFRQGPRPYAMSLVGVVHWLGVLAISVSYEFIQAQLKDQSFVLFIVLMAAFVVYIRVKVPETKNKTFEQISHDFNK